MKNSVKRYKLLLIKRKQFHFVFEEKSLKTKKDINEVEELFIFNNAFFYEEKTGLSSYERQFVKKSWTFI